MNYILFRNVCLFLCLPALFFFVGQVLCFGASSTSAVDTVVLDSSIQIAADYLIRACDVDGRFVYRVNLDPSVEIKPRYNLLRHAGTIYSLANWELETRSGKAKEVLKRASTWLGKTIEPLDSDQKIKAIWSSSEISGTKHAKTAKLGGSGLGLVGLCSADNVVPGLTPLPQLQSLGRFLLFMQKPDGSFHSKYTPSMTDKYSKWVSLYYPGEAALGLVMLFEQDGDTRWLKAAADALGYLASQRKGQKKVPADHWALLATQRLLPVLEKSQSLVTREELIEHACQIVRSILADVSRHDVDSVFHGCIGPYGRTTPTATRLEGLIAAMQFLPEENKQLRDEIRPIIDAGIVFLIRSQVRMGPYSGGIPRAIIRLEENSPGYSEAFNKRAGEIRIDYVQHALSAMLAYRKLCK